MDDFDRNKVNKRPLLMVNDEDRLSNLPDELLHQIFSCIDTKCVVQTCLLSSRWKVFWRSMPYLTLSSQEFVSLPKFSKFITKVLSRRNHQIDVCSVKLSFDRACSQVFVKRIARYAFKHKVQELIVSSTPGNQHGQFPLCLVRGSLSLKHFSFSSLDFSAFFHTPKTPWEFPVLTTLHLSNVTLHANYKGESIDLFSKCVNLKDLTLTRFICNYAAVFDIITPRLENLMLIDCLYAHVDVVNVISPQLKNLTVINSSIKFLNAPPVISNNFCYENAHPLLQLPEHCFRSLNKVTLTLKLSGSKMPYKEKDARATINMLQKLHSARFLTLNLDIVECLFSFLDLVSQHPSPFSNLICLNIDSREEAFKVKWYSEVVKYLLESSPNATFIIKEPPAKEMSEKEASEKKAKLIAEITSRMKEWQTSVQQENWQHFTRKPAMEQTKALLGNLVAELLQVLTTKKKMMQTASNKSTVQIEVELARLTASIQTCVGSLYNLYQQVYKNSEAIHSKEIQIILLLKSLPTQQRTEYSRQLKVTEILDKRLLSTLEDVCSCKKKIVDVYKEHVSHNISTYQDIARVAEDWAKRSSSHNIS